MNDGTVSWLSSTIKTCHKCGAEVSLIGAHMASGDRPREQVYYHVECCPVCPRPTSPAAA